MSYKVFTLLLCAIATSSNWGMQRAMQSVVPQASRVAVMRASQEQFAAAKYCGAAWAVLLSAAFIHVLIKQMKLNFKGQNIQQQMLVAYHQNCLENHHKLNEILATHTLTDQAKAELLQAAFLVSYMKYEQFDLSLNNAAKALEFERSQIGQGMTWMSPIFQTLFVVTVVSLIKALTYQIKLRFNS